MHIFVGISYISTEILELDVEATDTIENVKMKIFDLKGIAVTRQVLVYDQIRLQHGKTLKDYNIGDKATLQLEYRLGRGGK
ncbi:MAG: hypothetical protein EZS28_024447 [Streblomastix strix]|uniref:Ubiquitin-like domain-containing protein n=1 Tax=Streblomastix strix TaxID=222440 RepID=A0A5J4VC25_9EUKA|nr:MAG: hypothetical protein EZS28_024447 [Streblomastix strix]